MPTADRTGSTGTDRMLRRDAVLHRVTVHRTLLRSAGRHGRRIDRHRALLKGLSS